MQIVAQILFIIVLVAGIGFFARNIRRVIRNVKLGKEVDRSDNAGERFAKMARIAIGQSKMVKRPIAGFLHIIVYVGFIIINIEVLEIIIDGIFGTHRIFAFMGGFYDVLIASFEVLALLVFVGVILFWIRRNIINIRRFLSRELKGWPKNDANYILYFEMVLMILFLTMNAADYQLQMNGADHYASEAGIMGSFPISQYLLPLIDGLGNATLIIIERTAWWLHILGILFFLNYLYYSKHLHILLAFPNVYLSKLTPQGEFDNLEAVKKEVDLMMDPNADPFAAPAEGEDEGEPDKFGASDIFDLNQVQLLNSYTCTECGRCTSECPANQTGKKLSPRKIMMDTRDRVEEVGEIINKNGKFEDDGKKLLDDYILREELWACTTCNACVEACPIGIDPLSIILDMRRYLVMEESAAPNELAIAMTNIENNGAPWPYNQMDRLKWAEEK
ncbi:(Fe-S)-binding protein [Christiangramia forsetii]|uniref:Transmembrane [4Fe-4S] cluster-binding oxidoreductase n=2 Tax=Christiangramia forsetii TaxID=411153 RepID=A0M1W5_CHRFK|nr:(Fe-S)-binding protein [Christiangramia forsetii]GGG45190.1 Fe-S oxidoreductase [Christiangramia forsetii]CAL66610.1 transmembrane [4Fe-4S] cluster-binding oxidoreductase [Christiangramia forsetii KT0803]